MCKVTLPVFALVEETAISTVATADFTQMCGSYLSLGRHFLSLWVRKKTAAQGKILRNKNNSDFVLSPAEWRNSFLLAVYSSFSFNPGLILALWQQRQKACHGLYLLLETLKSYSEAGVYISPQESYTPSASENYFVSCSGKKTPTLTSHAPFLHVFLCGPFMDILYFLVLISPLRVSLRFILFSFSFFGVIYSGLPRI
jgi:hypothetical protein